MNKRNVFILLGILLICLVILGSCLIMIGPNPPDTVDDIRMTVKPTITKDGVTYLRLYYGYCVDGWWRDYPMEYYDLKSIFTRKQYSGYRAAQEDHIVKIGQYLLISFSTFSQFGETDSGYLEVSDSLNSDFQQMFLEYYSPYGSESDQKYGFTTRPRKMSDIISVGRYYTDAFGYHYYIILEYDSIPEDYKFRYFEKGGVLSFTGELTYDQIKELIEQSIH